MNVLCLSLLLNNYESASIGVFGSGIRRHGNTYKISLTRLRSTTTHKSHGYDGNIVGRRLFEQFEALLSSEQRR